MKQKFYTLIGGRLQFVLIASFSFVAALTVCVNTLAISRVISNYLNKAEAERIARDMDLADSFYQIQLRDTAAIGRRLVLDKWVHENLIDAAAGDQAALEMIDQHLLMKISVLALGGTHLIAILDRDGDIVLARVVSSAGDVSDAITTGSLQCVPIVDSVLATGKAITATAVLSGECLQDVNLKEQVLVPLIDTPKASLEPFDSREGTAGFALTGVYPYEDVDGEVIGAVLTAYIFNNDFTLVDRIKSAAGVDTVTIFFGDLRVSTNVMTMDGNRAVGTRVSQEVYDVVLEGGRDYIGEAFVVNDVYITRYKPIHDFEGNVIGMLYVGARQSSFQALVDAFRSQVIIIALVSILLAGIVAIPIARLIIQPIINLVDANQRLAEGDMTVRVDLNGHGELAVLAQSFNSMVEKLQRTQQELVHKEKLASVGQLAAGIAHEINNPLGTILLFSEVIYKDLEPNDPARDDLKMIISETTRCKNIVADLLNFAREQKILAEEVGINRLISNVIEIMRVRSEFVNIEFIEDYQIDIRPVQADPAQLHQVLINLIENAEEAMPNGGKVTISTRSIDNYWIEIKIADTGQGIPEKNLSKLFTPFFTTKDPGKGTGLGLSIVYGIIKMHSGKISVQSEIGRGTTFTILLPILLPKSTMDTHFNSS